MPSRLSAFAADRAGTGAGMHMPIWSSSTNATRSPRSTSCSDSSKPVADLPTPGGPYNQIQATVTGQASLPLPVEATRLLAAVRHARHVYRRRSGARVGDSAQEKGSASGLIDDGHEERAVEPHVYDL